MNAPPDIYVCPNSTYLTVLTTGQQTFKDFFLEERTAVSRELPDSQNPEKIAKQFGQVRFELQLNTQFEYIGIVNPVDNFDNLDLSYIWVK